MHATVENIAKMMTYLGKDSFVIPHHSLPLPFEADGENYRPSKIFRIFKNGLMEYHGYGLSYSRMNPSAGKMDITIGRIPPSDRWLTRAYIFLIDEVRDKVRVKTAFSHMKNVGKLVLKFNGLEFVDLA